MNAISNAEHGDGYVCGNCGAVHTGAEPDWGDTDPFERGAAIEQTRLTRKEAEMVAGRWVGVANLWHVGNDTEPLVVVIYEEGDSESGPYRVVGYRATGEPMPKELYGKLCDQMA